MGTPEATEPRVETLADGRRVAFATYGRPEGVPCFMLHGTPSSRLLARRFDDVARGAGVALIAPDRPGFGRSDPRPWAPVRAYPSDLVALADTLGFERFAVVGVSGGAPFALACGVEIPARLTGIVLLSGLGPLADHPDTRAAMAPVNRRLLALGRLPAPLARLLVPVAAPLLHRAATLAAARAAGREPDLSAVPEADREAAADPVLAADVAADQQEALRQGARALLQEIHTAGRAWGFRPEDVGVHVDLWHGESDELAPTMLARRLAGRLPDCTARFEPGGHLVTLTDVALRQEAFAAIAARS